MSVPSVEIVAAVYQARDKFPGVREFARMPAGKLVEPVKEAFRYGTGANDESAIPDPATLLTNRR